jgi:hypothetical protein
MTSRVQWKNTPDFGKEMRATLDWSDPDMLREMLRLRLVSGMHADLNKVDFYAIWHELCVSHYKGEDEAIGATFVLVLGTRLERQHWREWWHDFARMER